MERINFAYGTRNKRMHIKVSEQARKIICEESKKNGMTIGDYIVQSALAFNVSGIPKELEKALAKINAYAKENNIKFKKRTGVYDMEEKNKSEKGQFHLRVPQETFDEIRRKAEAFNMSVSDYVTFVTTCFDIKEISKKIDEINYKLDVISEQNKQ